MTFRHFVDCCNHLLRKPLHLLFVLLDRHYGAFFYALREAHKLRRAEGWTLCIAAVGYVR